MLGAIVLGACGVVFVTLGLVAALPLRAGGSSRGAWGAVALGASQLCHAAGMLAGYGGTAGVVLSAGAAACAVAGAVLVWTDRRSARSGRRRPRLPPLGG
ncbi:hypothetical protein [Streptomyces sp. NPDC020983]|uniref:hypothetical protein n=1 Tax=Streptomyces sp. NPDC020983 TaxID=3365106 RepID=UPI003790618C